MQGGPGGREAYSHAHRRSVTSLIAEEGIRALARSLPVVVREPDHLEARAEALYGARLGGTSLAAVGMAL